MSILRFKVQQRDLQEKMIIFSELNKFNDNSTIKENFDIWTQENKDLIETEYEFSGSPVAITAQSHAPFGVTLAK